MTNPNARAPAAHVPALARILADDSFPNGERAALKRMALDGPAPLALHRFLLRYIDEPWQGDVWLSDWRTLICALALQREGGFNPERPFGQALTEARFAESRLERLLAVHGDTLRVLALRAARQLSAKGIACDWRQFAELLFSRNAEARERISIRIARDFYRNLKTKKEE